MAAVEAHTLHTLVMKILLFLVFGLSCTCPPLKDPSFLNFSKPFWRVLNLTLLISTGLMNNQKDTGKLDTKTTVGPASEVLLADGCICIFDLAQTLCLTPFLTQPSHLSRLGTGTTSTLALDAPRLTLCLLPVSKWGSFARVIHSTIQPHSCGSDKTRTCMPCSWNFYLTGALHIILHCLTLQIQAID